MEMYHPEWIRRFGAEMRAERKVRTRDPLPEVILVKLRAIDVTEQQFRARVRERTPKKR
jgi:hypothetical protein